LYDSIFNDNITTQKLLVPFKIFAGIEAIKRDLQRKIKKGNPFNIDLLFLIDGAYHVLFTVAELCESRGADPFEEAKAKDMIPRSIDLIKELVKQESMRDDAFTASRFFKDAKTKAKIQRMITESECRRVPASGRKKRTDVDTTDGI